MIVRMRKMMAKPGAEATCVRLAESSSQFSFFLFLTPTSMKAHALERAKADSHFRFFFSLFICFHNRREEIACNIADVGEIQVITDKNLGDVVLGKLRQEYILDVELRGILHSAALDGEKMMPYKGQELFLITSVVCSEKFEVMGERKHEVCTLSSLSLWMTFPLFFDFRVVRLFPAKVNG